MFSIILAVEYVGKIGVKDALLSLSVKSDNVSGSLYMKYDSTTYQQFSLAGTLDTSWQNNKMNEYNKLYGNELIFPDYDSDFGNRIELQVYNLEKKLIGTMDGVIDPYIYIPETRTPDVECESWEILGSDGNCYASCAPDTVIYKKGFFEGWFKESNSVSLEFKFEEFVQNVSLTIEHPPHIEITAQIPFFTKRSAGFFSECFNSYIKPSLVQIHPMINKAIKDTIINKTLNGYNIDVEKENNWVADNWDKGYPASRDVYDISYNIKYYSMDIISLSINYYSYCCGAAHGNSNHDQLNYWMNNSILQSISLSQCFNSEVDYKRILGDYIQKQLIKKEAYYATQNKFNAERFVSNFNITPIGLEYYFVPNEVSSYSDGEYYVTIPFTFLKEFININGPLSKFKD